MSSYNFKCYFTLLILIFLYGCPKLWNDLALCIRNISSVNAFKDEDKDPM